MLTASTARTGRNVLAARAAAAVFGLVILASMSGQTPPFADAQGQVGQASAAKKDQHAHGAAAEQPPPKIFIDPPKPEPLSRGVALIQFRTENLQIVPVFGPAAASVSPRIGHLHVTLDNAPWHWVHTSNDPVIVAVLAPGPHQVLFEVADANHKALAQEVIQFDVPGK